MALHLYRAYDRAGLALEELHLAKVNKAYHDFRGVLEQLRDKAPLPGDPSCEAIQALLDGLDDLHHDEISPMLTMLSDEIEAREREAVW